MTTPSHPILFLSLALVTGGLITAQGGPPRPGPTMDWSTVENRIAWHGTVKGALDAAKRTGRPLLVMSAQPHCHGTPGIW